MAESNLESGEYDNTRKKGGGFSKVLVPILLLLCIILLSLLVYFQFKSIKKMEERESVRDLVEMDVSDTPQDVLKEKVEEGKLFPLENFTVNLAQGDGPRRFARLNLVLKFTIQSKEEEFALRTPQIRDAIISIVNTKRPEDLLKKDGKEYLKEEIKSSVNSFFVDGKVVDVYYVNFQIN